MKTKKLEISRVIKPEMVDLDGKGFRDKEALLDHMITMLFDAGVVDSKQEYLEAIYLRESMGPTYMGNFIAIPHGKCAAVKNPGVAFCRCDSGVFYHTDLGGGDVKLVFMLAIPDQMSGEEYMRVLSQLARLLVYPDFTDRLYQAQNYTDVINAIKECEAKLD
ncbi:MAG TPA: PTS sugar transporter [Anaerolineaceae bacterium]|nr:PTS sugar transporter [Anaerolineaceae bacterium]